MYGLMLNVLTTPKERTNERKKRKEGWKEGRKEGRKDQPNNKGTVWRKLLEMMYMFIARIVVMVMSVYQTHQIAYVNYVQVFCVPTLS